MTIQATAVVVEMPEQGISAHRGAQVTHPENTLAAFREAIWLGAQQIEFDVDNTSDGHLVIMHDATIDRTTNGSGYVSDYTLAELKALDAGSWKDPHFTGERIPTLAETLSIMPENIWLNVHMRDGYDNAYATTMEIFAQNREHQAFLSVTASQLQGVLDAMADAGKSVFICNMEGQSLSSSYVTATIDGGFDFLQLLNTSGALPSAADIQRLQQAGVKSNYFGFTGKLEAERWDSLRKVMAAGIDFPLVDDTLIGVSIAEELGRPALKPQFRGNTNLASSGFNVIVNPGAEIWYGENHVPCMSDLPTEDPLLTRDRELYGWNDVVEVTNVPYAASELTPSTVDFPVPSFGENAFMGGHILGSRWIEQTVDLTSLISMIDTKTLEFELSGWFGGQADKNDYTSLSAIFMDADGKVIETARIGTLNPEQWGDVTGMTFLSTDGLVPAGAREITVQLCFNGQNGEFAKGLADNLSLVFSERTSTATSVTSVPEPSSTTLLVMIAIAFACVNRHSLATSLVRRT